jgi:ribosomal-protein-alanine N-acetyltransferase
MKVEVVIHLAATRDAKRIAEMSRDYIERGLGWRWTAVRVLRCMHDPTFNVVGAYEQDRLVGFAIMEYREDQAHLVLLAVEPSRRRNGIAAALMAWLEITALVAGIGVVYLEARAGNAGARAFYRSLGYLEVRIRPRRYAGREDGVLFGKDLWLASRVTH